jgi:putative addiction module killer protein
MTKIIQTKVFQRWFNKLRDHHAKAAITEHVVRLALGFASDVKSIDAGVTELRVHLGPGYRVYLLQQRGTLVVLLCGGDKGSQKRDIQAAKRLAQQWRESNG